MKSIKYSLMAAGFLFLISCGSNVKETTEDQNPSKTASSSADLPEEDDFQYQMEQVADLKILRYKVPGFNELPLQQKEQLYYLYEAALAGRDMMWDQNYKHNLAIRKTIEAIIRNNPETDKTTGEWLSFMTYAKRMWFSNGIHHHYANIKFKPEFSNEFFNEQVNNIPDEELPLKEGQTKEDFLADISAIIFDPSIAPKKVSLNPDEDLVVASAVNFYENVTQEEVENYYKNIIDQNDTTPISYGLNSKLIKENGQIREKVWKVGGMYSQAIEKVAYWIDKAAGVAENDQQKKALSLLAEYYRTGDLEKFDEYNIAWVQDTASTIDVINGFIEVYNDPMGYRGSFESVVSIKDPKASKRIDAISKEAQYFEDNSPIMDEHKKENVRGISAKVINVVMESGDASPSTPIGINLPNANWIRTEHGSKSVNLANIVNAYDEASKSGGLLEEFAYSEEEVNRAKKFGRLAGDLHTDMHEVIGHASGKLNPGIGTPKETLKNYSSTLEEARADLVALYYLLDPKLIEMGLMPSLEVGKAEYDSYIRNGLLSQLVRLGLGEDLEEAHMRNRQLVAKWAYEQGKDYNVIERKQKEGKTYFVVNDYEKLREIFGRLLREIQRIKSEGDYEAGKSLVENYGVKVDHDLHQEVLQRFDKLNIAPYSGFINPKLVPIMEGDKIVDIKIEYPKDFTEQMMYYGENYSFLPAYN